ncbi:MAG: DUF2344 domain-containing protein, partial [Lachnospiraceae bacterium]|nr:DUF2344 domain-containing protein [Lachnospiraceae bacterium]
MSIKLRIKFSKHGEIKYIGHLDVMRYFQKVMRRSGTDIAYTEGFSPHQKMSFALALGVGVESEAEYMDIEVNSLDNAGGNLSDLRRLLNEVSAGGMEIGDIGLLPENSKNAMASVGAAAYEVGFNDQEAEVIQSPVLERAIERFKSAQEILVTKETKKKTTQLNLKEHVFKLELLPEKNAVYMLISAGSVVNIKPAMVMRSLFELAG